MIVLVTVNCSSHGERRGEMPAKPSYLYLGISKSEYYVQSLRTSLIENLRKLIYTYRSTAGRFRGRVNCYSLRITLSSLFHISSLFCKPFILLKQHFLMITEKRFKLNKGEICISWEGKDYRKWETRIIRRRPGGHNVSQERGDGLRLFFHCQKGTYYT